MRPERFELPTFWFVGNRYWTQRFLFNSRVSADMPYFDPFALNWVGIWVGVFGAPRYRLGQVVPQCLVVQLKIRTWFEDSSADWPLYLQHRPNRGGVLLQPARKAWGAIGTLRQLGGQRVIRPIDVTGLHGSDLPERRFRAVLDCGLFGGTPTKPSFWIHKRCGVDREPSPMTDSIPRESKGTSAVKL